MAEIDTESLYIQPDPAKAFHYVGSLLLPGQIPLGMVRWEGSDPGALTVTLRKEGAFWAHIVADKITALPQGADQLWLHRLAETRNRNKEEMQGLSEAAQESFEAMWQGSKALSPIVIKRLLRAFHLAEV